jgi:hypothetical protein
MKNFKKSLIVFILLLVLSCNKTNEIKINEKDNSQNYEDIDSSNEQVVTEVDSSNVPIFLTNIINGYFSENDIIDLTVQEGIYKILFEQKKIDEILKFRDFSEPKNRYFANDKTKRAFNPVLMAIDYYPDTLNELYAKRPDLFLHGHDIRPGDLGISPIIYIFRSNEGTPGNHIKALDFFFDNRIEWEKSIELYGTRNRGGNEYLFAGTLLTEANYFIYYDYLIEKGFETEKDISETHIKVWSGKGCNVYEQPGFENNVILRLGNNVRINPIKITLYKKDNYQWIYIMYNENQYGWIAQDRYLSYDTGI